MRNVDVATKDEIALGLQAHEVRVELGKEAEFRELAFLAGGATRKVRADDRQLARRCVKAQFHVSAFTIKFW